MEELLINLNLFIATMSGHSKQTKKILLAVFPFTK